MWVLGSGIQKPLGPRNPMALPGARTPTGVWGFRRVLRYGTQKLLDPVALPQGLGPGT
jgi:hypothetical protein